jgi:4-amino-4-deoxy-L-arabinose transferase-like glycosyltransferase
MEEIGVMEDKLPALPRWWTLRLFPGQRHSTVAVPGDTLRHVALLLSMAGLLFCVRLSCPLLEPDESRYAEIPRQMLDHGQLLEPTWHGQPYYHKPPLLYWLVMAAYSVLGVHDWAARLVVALASVATVLVTYFWGRQAFGARTGFASAVILCLSARFVYLGRMLTMDALLCLWVVAALAAAHRAVADGRLRRRWWALSALAVGLGLLTKGPVTLVLVLAPVGVFQLLDGRVARPSLRAWVGYLLLAVGVAGPWYGAMIWINPTAAAEFFWLHNVQRYLDPIDHEEPVWFFLPGLLLGTLPWSLLLLPLAGWLCQRWRCPEQRPPGALGFVLLALVCCVGFFSLSGCKRAGYILPALPLLALGCGCVWRELGRLPFKVLPTGRRRIGLAIVVFAGLLTGVCWWLPSYHRRFALRGQVRPHAELAGVDQVFCYPKRWDSVTFYLQREEVRVFGVERRDELVAAALAHPQTLLFVKTRFLPELQAQLPPGVEFVACGRQGPTLTVGKLQASRGR